MNKIFCPNCGTKLFYSIEKPNFCTSCGKSITAAFAASPSSSPAKEEDSSEDYEPLLATKLDVEIEKGGRVKLWEVAHQERGQYPSNTRQSQRS